MGDLASFTVPQVTLPPITREQLRAYAEASGDPNPIHLDDEVARKMGLPGVIAHGMLVAGFLAAHSLKSGELAFASARLDRFQVRFKAMTLLGDELSLTGSVKEEQSDKITLELVARNQRSETVATCVAVLSAAPKA